MKSLLPFLILHLSTCVGAISLDGLEKRAMLFENIHLQTKSEYFNDLTGESRNSIDPYQKVTVTRSYDGDKLQRRETYLGIHEKPKDRRSTSTMDIFPRSDSPQSTRSMRSSSPTGLDARGRQAQRPNKGNGSNASSHRTQSRSSSPPASQAGPSRTGSKIDKPMVASLVLQHQQGSAQNSQLASQRVGRIVDAIGDYDRLHQAMVNPWNLEPPKYQGPPAWMSEHWHLARAEKDYLDQKTEDAKSVGRSLLLQGVKYPGQMSKE